MIEMPKRSVTRFFIPLVDIMMLLFSMFLLLPMLEGSRQGQDGNGKSAAELEEDNRTLADRADMLKHQVDELAAEVALLRKYADPQISLEQLKKEIEELRKTKIDVLQKRLFLQVVAFDPNRNELVYFEKGPDAKSRVIANAKDVGQLVHQHEKQAEQNGLELFYVLLLPAFPHGPGPGRLQEYKKWFGDVPYQIIVTPP